MYSNDVPDAKPITMNGNGGNDTIKDAYNSTAGRVLTGGAGNDKIYGYGGNDAIDGGDGNDMVDGGEGNDRVRGGAGDDEMWGDHYKGPGADLLDGGPGTDTTEEWGIPSDLTNQPRTTVSLDGVANDGRPGEGDNVIGIERIRVSVVGDYVGSDGADEIKVINPRQRGSVLDSRAAAATTSSWPRTSTTRSTAAPATTSSRAAAATTRVTGGPGRDTIMGDATSSHCSWYSCQIPLGNDTINARDGEIDNDRLRDRRPTRRSSTRSTSSPTARRSTARGPGARPGRRRSTASR